MGSSLLDVLVLSSSWLAMVLSLARTRVQEGGCCWHRLTNEEGNGKEERETWKTCDGAEKTSVQATA